MADPDRMRERLRRAIAYPYAIPERSFLQLGARTLHLPGDLDLSGRSPLLAYGSNAAPEALARKLAPLPDVPLPLIRTELDDFDVVYSAHLSPYGAVPATLHPSPGTTAPAFVAYPTEEQLDLLSATEPNYERHRLGAFAAFLSRHGCLLVDGAPVALSAIPARGRRLAAMSEKEALELVRGRFFPGLSLPQMVEAVAATGGQVLGSP